VDIDDDEEEAEDEEGAGKAIETVEGVAMGTAMGTDGAWLECCRVVAVASTGCATTTGTRLV